MFENILYVCKLISANSESLYTIIGEKQFVLNKVKLPDKLNVIGFTHGKSPIHKFSQKNVL